MPETTYKIKLVVEGQEINVTGTMTKVSDSLTRIRDIGLGILAVRVFERMAEAIWNVGQQAFEAASLFQELTLRFEGLIAREIKSSGAADTFTEALADAREPAQDLLNWIKQISVTTPFTVTTLSRAQALNMAMGLQTEQAKEVTLAVGNFVAGMGLEDEAMQRIIYNFGQMIMQGKVTGTELRDLGRGAMVPITDVLQRMQENLGKTGMSLDQFRKMAAKGEYPVEDFIQAFVEMAQEEFPGAMERMALTFKGATNNVKDFIQAVIGGEVMGPVVNRLSRGIALALQQMMTPEFREDFQKFGLQLLQAFTRIEVEVENKVLPAFEKIGKALGIGNVSAEGFGKMLLWVVYNVIVPFIDAVSRWLTNMAGVIKWIREVGAAIWEWLGPKLQPVFEFLTEAWEKLRPGVEQFLSTFSGIGTVVGIVMGAVALLTPVLTAIGAALMAINWPIVLIVAAVAALATAWKNNWGGIRTKTLDAWAAMKPIFELVKEWLEVNIPKAIEWVKQAWADVTAWFQGIPKTFEDVVGRIKGFFADISEWFAGIGEKVGAAKEAGAGISDAIAGFFAGVADKVRAFLAPVIEKVGAVFAFIIPIIQGAAMLISSVLGAAFRVLAAAWTNVLLPAIQLVVGLFRDILFPLFSAIAELILTVVLTALRLAADFVINVLLFAWQAFVDFVQTSVVAVLNTVATIWNDVILPALTTVANFVSTVLLTAWQGLVTFWTTILLPALSWLVSVFQVGLQAALNIISIIVNTVILPAFQALSDFWTVTLVPALMSLANFFSVLLTNALNTFRTKVLDPIQRAFEGVKNAIKAVVEWIQAMIEKLRNLKLPNWLHIGSPTPFEMGLRGIADAMREVSKTTGWMQQGIGGLGTMAPQYMFNLTANYPYQRPGTLRNDIETLQLMYGS